MGAMNSFTHFDEAGQAHMVNVGDKPDTKRTAVASGRITMLPDTLERILSVSADKGDVLGVARIAAIQACKRTADWIPLCHPIALTYVGVEWVIDREKNAIGCRVTTETTGKTGVEMEALTGVSAGLLTIYDMCKAIDRGMRITDVSLLDKRGGRSGHWQAINEG